MRKINVLMVALTLLISSVALAEQQNVPAGRFSIQASALKDIFATGARFIPQSGDAGKRGRIGTTAGDSCDLAPSGECWEGDVTDSDPQAGWGSGDTTPTECRTKVVDLTTCNNRCYCIYNYNMRKCSKLECKRVAEKDREVCLTQCQIDFT